jgi:hypothetical protein
MNDYDRAQLAVWDYPIDDTYTKMWQTMVEAGMPNSLEEAIERIRNPQDGADYAYLGTSSVQCVSLIWQAKSNHGCFDYRLIGILYICLKNGAFFQLH